MRWLRVLHLLGLAGASFWSFQLGRTRASVYVIPLVISLFMATFAWASVEKD